MMKKQPVIDPSVFMAHNATVLGDITIGADSSSQGRALPSFVRVRSMT